MEAAKIERINFLARKSRAEGLTEAEGLEQKALREAYIAEVRESLKSRLDGIEIVDPTGNKLWPEEK